MGNLDPTAEEFRPRNPNHRAPPPTLFRPPPYSQPCYPYVGVQTATFLGPVGVQCPSAAAVLSTSPTRSLLLSLVPSETLVNESTLRRELELFGDVRGVQMEGLCEGMMMATVHFYDLRHAEAAFTAIRWHHMQHDARLRNHHHYYYASAPPPLAARGVATGRVVWAQYVVPACDSVAEGQNEGTIVVFNLDSEVDTESLRQIFEAFGIQILPFLYYHHYYYYYYYCFVWGF